MIDTLADVTGNSFEGRRYYGFGWVWRRLVAGLVDWLMVMGWVLLAAVSIAFTTAIVGLFSEYSFQTNFGAGLLYFGFPVACVVAVLRQVLAVFRVSSTGDTLGHQLFGLRIVDRNGEIIGRGRALWRHILGSPLVFVNVLPVVVLYLIASSFNVELIDVVATYWLLLGLIVFPVLGIANHVWMGFDVEGRGWHDWIAGTVVVSARVARPPRASPAVSLRSSASPSRSEGEEYSP